MEHSKNFNLVKKYYDRNLWTKKMVYNAVGRWITADEYKEIASEDYVAAQ